MRAYVYVLMHKMDEKNIREHCACMCENARKNDAARKRDQKVPEFTLRSFRSVCENLCRDTSREVEEIAFCNFYDGTFVPEFLTSNGATVVEG